MKETLTSALNFHCSVVLFLQVPRFRILEPCFPFPLYDKAIRHRQTSGRCRYHYGDAAQNRLVSGAGLLPKISSISFIISSVNFGTTSNDLTDFATCSTFEAPVIAELT